MDQRPTVEQVKSGFKIAGMILTSFVAVVLFVVGYGDVTTPEKHHVALGWTVLIAVIAAMLFTVKFWAVWFCAVASYLAVRSTVVASLILFGHKRKLLMPNAIGIALALWLITILSIKLYERRRFSKFNRVCFTAAATGLFWGFARLAVVGDNAMLLPLLVGIPLLLVSACENSLKHVFQRFFAWALTPTA